MAQQMVTIDRFGWKYRHASCYALLDLPEDATELTVPPMFKVESSSRRDFLHHVQIRLNDGTELSGYIRMLQATCSFYRRPHKTSNFCGVTYSVTEGGETELYAVKIDASWRIVYATLPD